MITNGACNLIVRSQFMKQITMNDEDQRSTHFMSQSRRVNPCSSNPLLLKSFYDRLNILSIICALIATREKKEINSEQKTTKNGVTLW